MKKGTFALIAVAGLATAVAAQPANPTGATYEFTVSNVVSPGNPMATVSLWAVWTDPARDWVFSAMSGGITAGDGVFSNAVNAHPSAPGSFPGTPAGNVVTGATLGQFHLPPIGFIGERDNPFLLATYDWTTTDFTIRTVSLDAANIANFIVAEWGPPPAGGRTYQMFPQAYSPTTGGIQVIPAPSALALLGLGGLVALRRRR